MNELRSMKSTQPTMGGPSLRESEINAYLPQVPEWEVVVIDDIKQLVRQFKFSDFNEALEFTNKIGELAEEEDHHPSILTEWGKVTVTWWTHAVSGLHLNDFISAAKSDQIYSE